MLKGIPIKRYTPEFKKMVIETMQNEKLSYCETVRGLRSTAITGFGTGSAFT